MGIIKATKDNVYITYLPKSIEFNPEYISTTLDYNGLNKPVSAWWGSPEYAKYGWKEWCETENFGDYDWDNPIRWTLKEGSKILQVEQKDYKEILKPYLYNTDELFFTRLNFHKMKRNGIDAVELMDAYFGHYFTDNIEMMFNTWDCESICVLDSSKIVFNKE